MRLNKDLKQTDIFLTGTITKIEDGYAYIDLITQYDVSMTEIDEEEVRTVYYIPLHDDLGYEVGDQVSLVWAKLNDSE
jgi:hypothetical protein